MKHIKTIILTLLITSFVLPTYARDFEFGKLKYTVLDEEAKTCETKAKGENDQFGGNTVSGDLEIPSVVSDGTNEYTVIAIGEKSFLSCTGLRSVKLPETLKVIKGSGFDNCSFVTTFGDLPNSLISIENDAFRDCNALDSIKIPDSVKEIGAGAFYQCSNLKKISLPSSIRVLPKWMFRKCKSLQTIVIPESLDTIKQGAFYGCSNLETVELPKLLKIIEYDAFRECADLNEIVIPDSIKSISMRVFSNCSSLKTVCLSSYTTNIYSEAFSGCTSLTSIDFPESLTSVGSNSFRGCTALTVAEFRDGLTTIESSAFEGCSNLKSVHFTKSLVNLEYHSFNSCPNISDVYYGASKPIEAESDVFDDVVYEKALLHMYNATEEAISSVSPWCLFKNIEAKQLPTIVAGDDFEYEGIWYTVIDPEAKTCRTKAGDGGDYGWQMTPGNRVEGDIVIPSTVILYGDEYRVIEVGDYGFSSQGNLTSMTFPNSLVNIGQFAFYQCNGLTSLTLPNSVEYIDSHAFWECENLVDVKFSKSLKFIGAGAFRAGRFRTLDFPESLSEIREDAFGYCYELETVKFPSVMENIGGSAFASCTSLTSVVLPEEMESVSSYIFDGCTGITEVTLPKSPSVIDTGAFRGCTALASIELPSSITKFGYWVFEGCTSLSEITYLAEVPVRSGVDMFDGTVYENAILNMPNAVITDVKAIQPWSLFLHIIAKDGNSGFVSAGDVFEYEGIWYTVIDPEARTCTTKWGEIGYEEDGTYYVISANKCEGDLVIPEVVSYGEYDFKVVEIGGASFCYQDLRSVSIPNTVTSIGQSAFMYCSNIVSIDFSESLQNIGFHAFTACSSLRSAELPKSLTYIGARAFERCSSLTSINIPERVTSIESCAFADCSGLPSINIPDGVTSIREGAFCGCSGLTSINIPEGVTSIEEIAFCGCSSLTSINIPEKVTSIGQVAFMGCSSLTSINIPEGVTSIGFGVFSDCSSLTSINIPDGVTSIGEIAFCGCSSLTSINIPEGVTSIGENAFLGCNSNAEVTYLATAPIAAPTSVFEDIYKTATLNMPNATLVSIQATEPWNMFQHIIAKDGSIGSDLAAGDDFEYQGIWYTVVNADTKTCKTKEGDYNNGDKIAGNKVDGDIVIPSVAYSGYVGYSVVEIGRYSFCNNTELTSVSIPESVNAIETDAFDDCSNLAKANFASIEALCNINFRSSSSNPLYLSHHLYIGNEEVTELVIPESVTSIKFCTFTGGSNLRSVEFHEGLTAIGSSAFSGCSQLTNVELPSSLISLGSDAFADCSSLYSIKLPEGIQTIGDQAFVYCGSLTSITIPAGITSIGRFAFYECTALSTVTYYAVTPIVGNNNIFSSYDGEIYSNATLNMPNATLADIQATTPWNQFKHIIAKDGSIGFVSVGEEFEYEGVWYTVVSTGKSLIGKADGSVMCDNLLSAIDNHETFPCQIVSDSERGNVFMCEILPDREYPWDCEFYLKSNEPLQVGDYFNVSFMYKCSDERLIETQAHGEPASYHHWKCIGTLNATPEWQRYSWSGIVEPEWVGDEGFMTIDFLLSSAPEAATFYVDDVVFELDRNACKTKDEGNAYSGDLVIPDQVSYESNEYIVVAIGEQGFSGSSHLTSISVPSTIESIGKNAFSGCERLTSLIWRGKGYMPSGVVESIDNPNLLVYVDDAQVVSSSLDHNVVADGICDRLVLTPGYAFTPVSDFTAKSSSFTKEFLQTTPVDGCAGWETIVLPFDVTRVVGPDGKAVTAFDAVTDVSRQRPYWLYEADPTGEWKSASAINAGVPYIISMPNNPRYNPAYNIHGAVTFSNPNPQLIATSTTAPYATTWASGREFRSLWLPLDDSEAATAMGLNVGIDNLTDDDGVLLAPGSAFHTGVLPKPLEAYVVSNGNARAFRIWGSQSAVLMLPDEDGLKISQDGGILTLQSSCDRAVDIFSADGTLLRRVELKAGTPAYIEGLPQGVCLIAGRKVMIR